MTQRVLLIGGSGFIGIHLAQKLIDSGVTPIIVDWVKPNIPHVEYHAAELRTIVDLTPDILMSVDTIYLLAWTTKPQAANLSPVYDLESNVLAGLHLLDGIVKLPKRPRLIFISSGGAIYGEVTSTPTPEQSSTLPISAYGISKLMFEYYLQLYHRIHSLDFLILRPSNPFGEGQNPKASQGAVGVFLGKLYHQEPIYIWGNGEVIRDYIYIKDLIEGMYAALSYSPIDKNSPRIFNLGSNTGTSLNELVNKIEEVTNLRCKVIYQASRTFDVSKIILDSRQAMRFLNWEPKFSLEQGLSRTWDWICNSWGKV